MPEDTTPVLGIEMPADLSGLSDKEIASLLAQVGKKFAPFNDEGKVISPEDLATMTALVEQKELLDAEQTTRAEVAAQVAAESEALRQRMGGGEGEGEEEAPAEDEASAEEAEAPAEEAPAEEVPAPEAVAEEPTVEAIAASAAPKPKAKVSARPRAVAPSKVRVDHKPDHISIVASSGVSGFDTGQELSRTELGQALHAKARGLRDRSEGVLVASVKNNTPKHDVSNVIDDESIRKAWSDAHNVEDMVASGGWCAPSDTTYDFVCDFESLPDALDLPSITSTRGGLRYPTSPLLSDVYDDVNSGFTWTEDDDIAAAEPGGPTKPCFVIPCPDFDEVRLQAQGICVTAGNLTDRAYPELTSRYIDLVMTAHAHRMNALTIAKVEAASTATNPTEDADLGAAEALFGHAEFIVNRFRDVFFASEDFVLEAILPRWARSVVRRDLARRNGVEFDQISNADITSAFAEIGARPQFVSNWQGLAAADNAYPATVKMMLYPAGTHTRLDGGSLDLGVVRDSTLNATNDYTAAWTEEFWGVVSRCASYVTTVPVCASGNTGAQVAVTCPTV